MANTKLQRDDARHTILNMIAEPHSRLSESSETLAPLGAKDPPRLVQRISALDFTKGALVLIMVLYHWLNYFVSMQGGYYIYLRFLTPSFIFISGFMISNVYLSKYAHRDRQLARRLVSRGGKLLGVFAALNFVRLLATYSDVTVHPLSGYPMRAQIISAFTTGDYAGRAVAFYILIPISYLLIASGLLVFALRPRKYIFHALASLLFIVVAALATKGISSNNLDLLAIGILGAVAGCRPITVINEIAGYIWGIGFLYICYLIAITRLGDPYALQIVGVLLSVLAIYAAGMRGEIEGLLRRKIILIGKYSLLGYIAQIAILQVLVLLSRHAHMGMAALPVTLSSAAILTILVVEAVDRLRKRAELLDKIYRAVFA